MTGRKATVVSNNTTPTLVALWPHPWSSLVEGGEGSYLPIVKQLWLLPLMHCLYCFVFS